MSGTMNASNVSYRQSERSAQHTRLILSLLMWAAVGLALSAAAMYVLIALDILAVGMEGAASGALVAWVMGATGYALGGLLILTRRRGLWITGAVINGMILLAFLQKYTASPEVMFSPGGLATKIPQMLLEAVMFYLIFATAHTHNKRTTRTP